MVERTPKLFKINVVDGVGQITEILGGNGILFGVRPPAGGDYKLIVKCCDDFTIYPESANKARKLNGEETLPCWVHFFGKTKLIINGPDGEYWIKVWFEE